VREKIIVNVAPDIKEGKVWISSNGTERAIADDLMGLGVLVQERYCARVSLALRTTVY
jgi:hypothetical protein